MRFVVQRVTHASVTVDSQVIGKIGNGFMVLIGVADTDTREIADKMVKKLLGLRIFEDENGKTNCSLADVDGELIGSIGRGYMVLMGVSDTDTEEITDKMVDKMCKLRIFEDENGKTNCSLADVDGEILLISQFTLYADCSHGNRPGFTGAGNPELANALYEHALARCAGQVRKVEHGIFGADMKVELLNDGPFTILLDSDTIVKKK